MAKGKNNSGGPIGGVVAFLLAAGLIFAFFSIPEHQSVDGTKGWLERKSASIEIWVKEQSKTNFGLDNLWGDLNEASKKIEDKTAKPKETAKPEPKPKETAKPEPKPKETSKPAPKPKETAKPAPKPTVDPATPSIKGITAREHTKVAYNRKDWVHWTTKAGKNGQSCWTVREEVLHRQAKNPVLKDKSGNITTDYMKACEITGGTWVDSFSGKTFTNPRDLDIDHIIPLHYTAKAGGQDWSKDKKKQYANDLNGDHLLAVSAKENRTKGDKGPSAWQPPNQANHCAYAKNWITIATNYKLGLPKADIEALSSMLKKC